MSDKRAYTCSAYKHGHACENNIRVEREIAESMILKDVESDLLSDDVIAIARKEAVAYLKIRKQEIAAKNSDKAIQVELAEIDKKLGNLVGFIAEHGHDDSIKAELDRLKSRRDELLAESQVDLSDLDSIPDLIPQMLTRYRDKLLSLVRSPAANSVTQVAQAKSILRKCWGK